MKYFDFKKRDLWSGYHLLGTLLIFSGVFVIFSPLVLASQSSLEKLLVVGVASVIIGLVITFTYDGTLIDFEENSVKEYQSISGYKSGRRTKLPVISTIKVISRSYFSTNTPNGISRTLSGKITEFRILLLSENQTPVLTFRYRNQKVAVDTARKLATQLKATLEVQL